MIIDNYSNFISQFADQGYQCVSFEDFNYGKNNQLLLRHDIDQDCELAYIMSCREKELKIKSTYFFLLRNNCYNLLSEENYNHVKNIRKNGHSISLHFDPTIYTNKEKGLKLEIDIFQNLFNEKIKIISLHRPSSNLLGSKNLDTLSFPNTYEDRFFKDISYFSDSRGQFKFGNPLNSNDFKNSQNMQLLIHPIWWIGDGLSVYDRLNWFKEFKMKSIENNLKNNFDFYGK